MNRILFVVLATMSLTACEFPKKVSEESRIVYVSSERISEDEENGDSLYFTITDDETKKTWEVYVGSECKRYPFNFGERFLARFDRYHYESKPKETWIDLHSSYDLVKEVCGNSQSF